jgi:hypothetical protein
VAALIQVAIAELQRSSIYGGRRSLDGRAGAASAASGRAWRDVGGGRACAARHRRRVGAVSGGGWAGGLVARCGL